MSSKEKKQKKHHHHHHHHGKGSVVPPKKSKNKHDKKKKETKRERSSTKLHGTTSNASLRRFDSKHKMKKQEEISTDGSPFLPTITVSDTCVNMFTEQISTPTKVTTAKPNVVEKVLTPMAASPTPTAAPIMAPIMAPTPPPALSPPPVPAQTVTTQVKWKAEEVALAYIDKLDATMARLEYIEACAATKVNVEKDCLLWKKNLQKNQTDAYPIIDATIVKILNQPDDYVNMSSIIVPHCRYPILMAQMPKRGCEEEFWRAAFTESVVMMYILMGTEDEKNDFFPTIVGSYVYYGAMFVNIRKVEKMDEERTRYTIEVLPNGFSNSVMINVYVHIGWEPFGVPVKYANTTRSVVDVMNFVKTSNGNDKMMVVSKNGCGRAGFFLSLGAAFCCLNDSSEPRIGEIVKAIRFQRPNAVESMKQYASLYLCLLYYIKKKITIPEGMKQKVDDVTKAFEGLIREDLSIMY